MNAYLVIFVSNLLAYRLGIPSRLRPYTNDPNSLHIQMTSLRV